MTVERHSTLQADTPPAVAVSAQPLQIGDPRYPDHQFVLAYWERLRGDRIGPKRTDLDPHHLKKVLPRITLIVRDTASNTFRFRLAGTTLYHLNNKEISKLNVEDLSPTAYVNLLTDHYEAVFDTGQPNAFEISFRTDDGLKRWYATLRVPLSDDGKTVDGIMSIDNFCDQWVDILPYIQLPGTKKSA